MNSDRVPEEIVDGHPEWIARHYGEDKRFPSNVPFWAVFTLEDMVLGLGNNREAAIADAEDWVSKSGKYRPTSFPARPSSSNDVLDSEGETHPGGQASSEEAQPEETPNPL